MIKDNNIIYENTHEFSKRSENNVDLTLYI